MNLQFTKEELRELIQGNFDNKFFYLLWQKAIEDNKANWLILTPESKRIIAKAVYIAKGSSVEGLTDALLSSAFSRWTKDLKEAGIVGFDSEDRNKMILHIGFVKEPDEIADEKELPNKEQESKANDKLEATDGQDLVIHANNVTIMQLAKEPENKGKGSKKKDDGAVKGKGKDSKGKKGKQKKKKKDKLSNRKLKFD